MAMDIRAMERDPLTPTITSIWKSIQRDMDTAKTATERVTDMIATQRSSMDTSKYFSPFSRSKVQGSCCLATIII